jgi:Tfp pilus assembly protein PilX
MLNQRGIALPLTLMILMALMALTMALLSYAAYEPVLSRNLAESAQARFAAEAGLEQALGVLAGTRDWDTVLVGATWNALLPPNSPIGNLPPTRGTFTVNLRNDTFAADPAITGTTNPQETVTDDQNVAVIVTATGIAGTASKTLEAAIKRPTPLPFPAALALPGNEAELSVSGNAFQVSGNGWKMDGSPDPKCVSESGGAPAYGISVSPVLPASNPGSNEAKVEGAIGSVQKDNVTGKQQPGPAQPGPPGQGNNTIARDPILTPQMIQKYIDEAKQAANIKLESKQPSGLEFSNIGDSCSTDPSSQTCWGTAEDPKVVWIKGDPDPSSQFSALQLKGHTTGYGVLIVEDGDLRVSGNFTWNGPIIVTGKWVGVGYLGGGEQQVYGAVISNETATDPGFMEGVVTGNAKIRYSCEALALAQSARGLARIVSWKDVPQ